VNTGGIVEESMGVEIPVIKLLERVISAFEYYICIVFE